jgi:hypothetical protein
MTLANIRNLFIGFAVLFLLWGCTADEPEVVEAERVEIQEISASTNSNEVPVFSVDASWPKPLPNDWILGQVAGIAVDSQDHIWIIHRPRTLTEHEAGAVQNPPATGCCVPAPSILEFDQAGDVISAWGGPVWNQATAQWDEPEDGWPAQEHGIFVDYEDNLWVGGNAENDHVVLKYRPDGERIMMLGEWNETGGSNDPDHLGRPADVHVDPLTNEVYVADGYGNRRVIVFDASSGEYKRHWGAYGNAPDDSLELGVYTPEAVPFESFWGPVHSVNISNDGLVYIADRVGNRLQVFNKDGSFVREGIFAEWTIVQGSAWDIEFSNDPEQTWIFIADGANMKVWIMRRDSLEIVSSFGTGGRQAGQFNWVHNLTMDSSGNLYTAEVNTGKRIQKFSPAQ